MHAYMKEYHLWMLAESVSQCSIKFENVVIDSGMFKQLMQNNGEIIFHLKRILRILFCYKTW